MLFPCYKEYLFIEIPQASHSFHGYEGSFTNKILESTNVENIKVVMRKMLFIFYLFIFKAE